MARMPPVMSKLAWSGDLEVSFESEYAGLCPPSIEFCAEIAAAYWPPADISVVLSRMYQGPRFCEKADAPLSMLSMLVAPETFHPDMSELKAVAPLNIKCMSSAPDTFHAETSELKAVAPLNMPAMSRTLDTFHAETSPSKEVAPRNMSRMVVTADTSQPERSPSKEVAPLNM